MVGGPVSSAITATMDVSVLSALSVTVLLADLS